MDNPPQNRLLGALPPDECARLSPHLELVSLPLGYVLHESCARIRYAYFPTTAIVPMLHDMENGASTEIAMIGNEGMVGVSLFMGGDTMTSRAVVESAGHAYRLNGELLKDEFTRSSQMQSLLLRYTQALFTQVAQLAVCNRHHSVAQQLSRWLLMSLDRLPSNTLTTTHELMANMLGVRREGITEATGKLQHSGLIQHSRGKITVVDRSGLEACACECYQAIRQEFDRLLPKPAAQRACPGANAPIALLRPTPPPDIFTQTH